MHYNGFLRFLRVSTCFIFMFLRSMLFQKSRRRPLVGVEQKNTFFMNLKIIYVFLYNVKHSVMFKRRFCSVILSERTTAAEAYKLMVNYYRISYTKGGDICDHASLGTMRV